LKRLYRLMVLTRNLDIRGLQLQRQGRIGFYIGCLGQEAAQIGSGYALKPEDWVFPAYREVGTALQRGVTLKQLMNQYFANAEDLEKGRQLMNLFGVKAVNFVTGRCTSRSKKTTRDPRNPGHPQARQRHRRRLSAGPSHRPRRTNYRR